MAAARVNRVEVVHLDSAKSVVTTAFKNACLSGLAERPVRYIIDDCTRFLEREIVRRNKYDGLIFDPPAFGRSAKGVVWKLDKHLPLLVSKFPSLLSPCAKFVLLTCHDPEWPGKRLAELLNEHLPADGQIEYGDLVLSPEVNLHAQTLDEWSNKGEGTSVKSVKKPVVSAAVGNDLPLGQFARWYREFKST